MILPDKGLSETEIDKKLDSYRLDDIDWASGKVFGYVFDPGAKAMEVGKRAYMKYLTENALDFTSFPSLHQLEKDLVEMGVHHLNGNQDVVGNFTSGGTESIILAMKSARDFNRQQKPEIHVPEVILPVTAHAAFHKAANYLGIKVEPVGVDSRFKANIDEVEKAITPNTILIVGSAPSYAHGVVDPISEMADIALKHDILFHVDACVGGFMLPFFKRLGEPVPDFDFSVAGVTSISMDLHKYAYTPKGASLVLYRNREIRKHQIFACARWTGYTVINNAVMSSRSGGPMAAAFAVLNYIGDDGYLDIARRKLEATKSLIEGIEKHADLRLMTRPEFCMFSFSSDTINVFNLIDAMNSLGWYIQPALAYGSSKQNIHLSINQSNVEWVDAFLKDLDECVEKVKSIPPDAFTDAIKSQLASIDPDNITDAQISQLLQAAQTEDGGFPKETALINETLNALPVSLRERLLVEYTNAIF